MLRDYRDWLESELKLLGNASHHAYSFGQANMAKRALEKLDAELSARLYLPLDKSSAMSALTALESLDEKNTALNPDLNALRESLKQILADETPPPKA
ncbi:MAG: hypothetical protein JOY59_04000 [Candidatus Eremiobacteraeota bacterium]|nr:hypothetical protein [Candidatus Eremiobacteraeota bacterium]